MTKFEVRVDREVSDERLLREPVRWFLGQAKLAVWTALAPRTPIDTGNLRGNLSPGGPVTQHTDTYAIVGTNVKYGRSLNQSKTKRYRATSYAGEKVESWFDKGVEDSVSDLERLADSLADRIEAAWRA